MPTLENVQRWFLAAIRDPQGLSDGLGSAAARAALPDEHALVRTIVSTPRLGAAERLRVYHEAFRLRLVECLGEFFPALKRALGEDVFTDFALGYLADHPSRSYTLNRLGDHFAAWLDRTRPDRGDDGAQPPVAWPDFLVDLAGLEWTVLEIFDGPGHEDDPAPDLEPLRELRAERLPEVRFVPAVSLALRRFRYPVNDYYTAFRASAAEDELALPGPGEELVALHRRDFVVRRAALEPGPFHLLEALVDGVPLGAALERAAPHFHPDAEPERMLHSWFAQWTSNGILREAILPD